MDRDPELFWYFEQSEASDYGGIREPRGSYNTDLAQNDLIAWKNAIELAVVVYEVTKSWPRAESYGLTSQTRRAAVSVAANIAEGQGRASKKEFLHFLHIAQGSLREVETHLVVARRVGLLDDSAFSRATHACMHSRKPLRGLINHLNEDRTGGR
ncbi:MAG TPA: four helix bundle protein [Thermomicrobiales bacterium]|nr:four helix bundle protein [Thermomicrobiales bacterium]